MTVPWPVSATKVDRVGGGSCVAPSGMATRESAVAIGPRTAYIHLPSGPQNAPHRPQIALDTPVSRETAISTGVDSSGRSTATVAHLPSGETATISIIGAASIRRRPFPSLPMRSMKLLLSSSDFVGAQPGAGGELHAELDPTVSRARDDNRCQRVSRASRGGAAGGRHRGCGLRIGGGSHVFAAGRAGSKR
jgi:hypothetical protein